MPAGNPGTVVGVGRLPGLEPGTFGPQFHYRVQRRPAASVVVLIPQVSELRDRTGVDENGLDHRTTPGIR